MKDNSGPAFPLNATNSNKVDSAQGMTKRELIAMGQMQVMRKIYPGMEPDRLAREAKKDADALLAELAKDPS